MSDAEIGERLERLERAHRRLKRTVLFVLLVPVFGFAYARAAKNTNADRRKSTSARIAAGEFDLVDAQGKFRAKMGFDKTGEPSIELYDEQGKTRARLCLLSQALRDEPAIELSNGEGRHRIEMFLSSNDGSMLSFLGKENSELDLGFNGLGFPRITLLDEPGKSELNLGRSLPSQQAAGILTYDIKQGKVTWKAP